MLRENKCQAFVRKTGKLLHFLLSKSNRFLYSRLRRFTLPPLKTSKIEPPKKEPGELLKQMKTIVNSSQQFSNDTTSDTSCSSLDYIFVTQSVGDTSETEDKLSEFLDKTGIYQIHLSSAMQEFN